MVKKAPKKARAPLRRRRVQAQGGNALGLQANQRLISHVNMVRDPCNSVVGQTAYRGKDGFVNRFNSIYSSHSTGAAASNTVAVIAYWPRYNRVFQRLIPTDTFDFSLNFFDGAFSTAGPGGAFLGTNAGETRPVAACITTSYMGTELDRQGQVVRGVVPNATTTGTLNVTRLRQICQQWSRTADGDLETKWIPSSSDEEYEVIGAAPNAGHSDDNIIVHLMTGFGEGKLNFYHRITNIFEWQPFYGLGLVCPTPNTPDPPAGLEKVRTALSTMGHWWLEATHTAATVMNVGRQVYAGARALGVATARVAPLLLTAA